MHDSITGERLGLPSVGIMTTQFVSAAQLMARVLGADDYPFVVIDHPVSSASDEELSRRAKEAVAASVDILLGANNQQAG